MLVYPTTAIKQIVPTLRYEMYNTGRDGNFVKKNTPDRNWNQKINKRINRN